LANGRGSELGPVTFPVIIVANEYSILPAKRQTKSRKTDLNRFIKSELTNFKTKL
jgi:hypothetical protein